MHALARQTPCDRRSPAALIFSLRRYAGAPALLAFSQACHFR